MEHRDDPLRMRDRLWEEAAQPEGAWVTVFGDSMLPTLAPGARVRVRAKPPRLGDVIAFATADGSRTVLHRVIACAPGVPWIVQAGDCQRRHADLGIIRREQLIGVAELPRRLPSPRACWAAARALAAAVGRRMRRR